MKNISIEIDKEKCTGCSLCVKDCVASNLYIIDGKASVHTSCIECGHCFAICPSNAVTMKGYNDKSEPIVSMEEFDSEKLLSAMKSRRTIRQFKDTPVEQEKIDMILEAGRVAPTGANSQNTMYTILGSKQDDIEKECVKLFRFGVNMGKSFSETLKNTTVDDHFFFKGAPLVIVVSGSDDVNSSLASSYMEIMANSLGLGVLYSGFFIACSKLNPKITKMLNLPKGHKPITCMVIGYPKVKYQRTAPRKKLKTQTL